jgi:hypothetical protein
MNVRKVRAVYVKLDPEMFVVEILVRQLFQVLDER